MTMMRDLQRLDVLPASLLDGLQQFLSTQAANAKLYKVNDTTVGIDYGGGNSLAALAIMGRWRFRGEVISAAGPPPVWSPDPASGTATHSAAHPGGAVGTYDVYAKATDNAFVDTPNPDTDNTDYRFYLEIRATGSAPTSHPLFRRVATVVWDGTKITRINHLIGTTDAAPHAAEHLPAGSDSLSWTTIHRQGTAAAMGLASAWTGTLYYQTDTKKIMRSDGTVWQEWAAGGSFYTTAIGNGVLTTVPVAHNLGTREVVVAVRQTSAPYQLVQPEVRLTGTGSLDLIFAQAPSAGEYTIMVISPVYTATVAPSGHATTHSAGGTDPVDHAALANTIHLQGTTAARPVAAAANNGYLYFATDTGSFFKSNGVTWTVFGGATPKVIRTSHTFQVPNDVLVASGDVDYIMPFAVSLAAGETKSLVKVFSRLNSQTSGTTTFTVSRNGVAIAVFTNLTAAVSALTAEMGSATGAEALSEGDRLSIAVTAAGVGATNLSVTLVIESTV